VRSHSPDDETSGTTRPAPAAGCRHFNSRGNGDILLAAAVNDTGKPCTEVGSRVRHNSAPVFTSTRGTHGQIADESDPPPVDNTAVRKGARCVTFHTSLIVFTSYAPSLATFPPDPGISKKATFRGSAARAFLKIRLAPEHFHAGLALRGMMS